MKEIAHSLTATKYEIPTLNYGSDGYTYKILFQRRDPHIIIVSYNTNKDNRYADRIVDSNVKDVILMISDMDINTIVIQEYFQGFRYHDLVYPIKVASTVADPYYSLEGF
jgi:hypothetical protein